MTTFPSEESDLLMMTASRARSPESSTAPPSPRDFLRRSQPARSTRLSRPVTLASVGSLPSATTVSVTIVCERDDDSFHQRVLRLAPREPRIDHGQHLVDRRNGHAREALNVHAPVRVLADLQRLAVTLAPPRAGSPGARAALGRPGARAGRLGRALELHAPVPVCPGACARARESQRPVDRGGRSLDARGHGGG